MSAKIHLLLFLVFIGIIALNAGLKSNDYNSEDVENLNSGNKLDSMHILKNLIGEWDWDSTLNQKSKAKCYSGIIYKLVFFPDFNLNVIKKGSLIANSKWAINKKGRNYTLTTCPVIDNVFGYVSVGDKILIMKDMGDSGMEYYFSKNH